MTKRIVDDLEAVEIEQVDSYDLATLGAGQRLGQALTELHAIGQTRKSVMAWHVHDRGVRAALLGNVAMGCNPATIRHGAMVNLENATIGQLDHRICRLI